MFSIALLCEPCELRYPILVLLKRKRGWDFPFSVDWLFLDEVLAARGRTAGAVIFRRQQVINSGSAIIGRDCDCNKRASDRYQMKISVIKIFA
jgi:hypothetical protein